MAKTILQELLLEKINFLKLSFQTTAKRVFYDEKTKQLIHPGEFGIYRENVLKDFLRLIIPQCFEIGSGFVINGSGDISTQCDFVIYDRNITPLIENDKNQVFFPIESVVAIGEAKSTLSKSKFKEALNKLAHNKAIRSKLKSDSYIVKRYNSLELPFSPELNPIDNIITFIICNDFSFKEDYASEIDTYYEESIPDFCKHNLILSLSDGLLLYRLTQEPRSHICFKMPSNQTEDIFIEPHNCNDAHILEFARLLFGNVNTITVALPDLYNYLEFSMIGKK